MALNPSTKPELLNNPTQRANQINDPQFENQQGYYPYDLTHQELITPLFGEITPCMHLDTVPADRIVVKDNTKTIRNQINGNLLSTVNQYVDSFFVSLRTLYPHNYEKLIPNPTKGSDLPNSALPQVPFNLFVDDYFTNTSLVGFYNSPLASEDSYLTSAYNDLLIYSPVVSISGSVESNLGFSYAISRVLLMANVLSRGQLLDYLGVQYDKESIALYSDLQQKIDAFYRELYTSIIDLNTSDLSVFVSEMDVSLSANHVYFLDSRKRYEVTTLPLLRSAISDIHERGKMVYFDAFIDSDFDNSDLMIAYFSLLGAFEHIFNFGGNLAADTDYIEYINTDTNPFNVGYLNISKVLAYQLIVAQYYSNDSIDNIFNSDLYMQLLRSVMFPSVDGFSSEPTFLYNGVTTEYDYISAGAFYHALLNQSRVGHLNRQYVYATLMFIKRRSLRYGDYFSTARHRMLAVGQLSIDVENGMVSPIDVTQNLLKQRYLNAVNYIGSGFMNYMASIHGVTPSDSPAIPRFVTHRKITLNNQLTNNTADEQGKQSTNLVGFSDDTGFDVFIDDFGVLLSLVSFDVLPVYTSGIDPCYHLADRFDYFNPMLQNIGDQPIRLSEFIGDPQLRESIFGYTMRNAEYKFKTSRAHGAFVNDSELAGFLIKYPYSQFVVGDNGNLTELRISSDFIRDKPYYLDTVLSQSTGYSPAQYWHFLISCNNQVQCARKIQATPSVLF